MWPCWLLNIKHAFDGESNMQKVHSLHFILNAHCPIYVLQNYLPKFFFSKRRTIFEEYSPNLSHSMHHHHQLFHDIENVFAALTYWRLRLKISCIECTCALRKVALIRVGKSGEDTGLDISPRLCSFLWQFLALSEARVPRTRAVNTYERHNWQGSARIIYTL